MEILNKEVAFRFRELLLRDLNLDVDVVFENKRDAYKEVGKHMEEKERIVIQRHREQALEAFSARQKRS